MSEHKYILFFFGLAQPRAVIRANTVTGMLMKAQATRCYPDRISWRNSSVAMPFNVDLCNFLVIHFEEEGLWVSESSLPILAELTRVIRDVLQLLHQKVPESKLPSRFRHGLSRYGNRNRAQLTQEKLGNLLSNLLSVMAGKASAFLAKERWGQFHNDLKTLCQVVADKVELVKEDVRKQQARHLKESDSIQNRLRNKTTIEPSKYKKICEIGRASTFM